MQVLAAEGMHNAATGEASESGWAQRATRKARCMVYDGDRATNS